jgi:N-acetylmuramoyl-L-alanine amidase
MTKKVLVPALLLLLILGGLSHAASEGRKAAKIGGRYYLSVNDAAVLLKATKFWNGETKKAELNVQGTRIRVTVGSPVVAVSDRTYVLPVPVLFVKGVAFVPVELFSEILPQILGQRIIWDAETHSLSTLEEGLVPVRVSIRTDDQVTYVTIESPERIDYSYISSTRDAFTLLLDNAALFAGVLPRKSGLVSEVSSGPAKGGIELRLALKPNTLGYSLKREARPEKIVLSFTSSQELVRNVEYSPLSVELPRGTYRVVVIDPGHGGADEGARGPNSLEKDISLAIARDVEEILSASRSLEVLITRSEDVELKPEERAARANAANADLFISIHCDGYAGADARGYSVGIFEPGGVRGYASPGGGANNSVIPWTQVAGRHTGASALLARTISGKLGEAGMLRDAGFARTPLAIFYGVNMPAVLVSCGFLTNPADEALLRDLAGQRKIAGAIARGIIEFVTEAHK